jgi:molybdopterin converting factor small subunit
MNILDKEKVSLINEIVSSIGQELFSIPVKNYKLFATTQFLLNETRNSFKYSTVEERLKLKTSLIENIKKSIEKTENDKIDGLTLRLLKNKYIKKYSALLNDNQQLIIARYNNYLNSNNGKDMISFLKEEFNKIYKNIHSFVAINQDHENASLLKEACQKIKSLQIKEINDDIVYEAMRYWDVVEDLKLEESQNV